MAVFRLNLVTEEEIIKCLGEDRVAIVFGSRTAYEEQQCQTRGSKHQAQPETELETCSCPCPTGGMYNQPTSRINDSRTEIPFFFPQIPKTPEKKHMSTQVKFFDKVLGPTNESVEGLQILSGIPRAINAGLTPKPSIEIPGKERKASQTDPPQPKKKVSWGTFSGMSLADQIKILTTKALFPAGSSEASLSGIEGYDNELDSEWLSEYSGSESSTDYMEEARKLRDKEKLFAFFANIPVEPQSWRMKQKLGPLFGLMTCLGINPYTTFIRKTMYNYKIEPFSLRYISFFLVLLLTSAITGISWANFLIMFSSVPEGLPFPRYTEYLELEKYWPYVFFHLLSFAAVTARGAIIYLRNGKRSVEFMNRWHFAVIGVKYDPYEDIAGKIQLNIGYAGIYSLLIIILYIRGFAIVRDACGLFGILLCRGFTPGLRTGGNYNLVRLTGLFMHIYITFAERMIITYMLVYCKLLDNFARNWNLRMAYTLGMLGQFEEREYTAIRFVTKIPFNKLYAEHLLITTFAKLTGKVFNVNFILFFLVKFIDISMLAYRVITFMTVPGELNSERFEEEFLDGIYVDRKDRVRFQDPVHYQFLCVFVIFFITLLGWFLTTLDIIEPGRTIQSTFGFVRRWGFMQCTSCAMKRFIMSLNFTLSNPGGYYFSPGFTIDRKFITYSALWTFFFILQILAFNPYKVNSIPVDLCTRDPVTGIETCVKFHAPPDFDSSGIENRKEHYRSDPPIELIIDPAEPRRRPPYFPQLLLSDQMTTSAVKPTTCGAVDQKLCFGNGDTRAILVFSPSNSSNTATKTQYGVEVMCCYSTCNYKAQDFCYNKTGKGFITDVTLPPSCLDKKIQRNYFTRYSFYMLWAAADVNRRQAMGQTSLNLDYNEIKAKDKTNSLDANCTDELKYTSLTMYQRDNYTTTYRNFFYVDMVSGYGTAPEIDKMNFFGSYDLSDKDNNLEWTKFSNCVCKAQTP